MKSPLLSEIFTRLKALLALIIITASLFNTGCSSLSFTSNNSTQIEIHYSSPDRISFQGKGAGAGMALMSTMGPVGIALGVAIDEGIAKDIRETAKAGNVDFKEMFSKAVLSIDILKNADRIEVKKYGFVIKDGSKDYVAAEVHLKVINEANKASDVILSSWPSQQETENWVTLDDVKSKSEKIEMLFKMALEH